MPSIDKTLDILHLQFTNGENESQLLILVVDEEEFGLNIRLVQEIIRFIQPTKIPNTPPAVHGVINFRGEVIPVINIRERFNLSAQVYDEFTVIVVVEHESKIIGLIVDKVSDIINLPNKSIQPLSEITFGEKMAYLKGMGKLGERLILLLDIEKITVFREKNQMD